MANGAGSYIIKEELKGLRRALIEQEINTVYWLGDCDYETRDVITDLFKELVERMEYFMEEAK
jgi:hypothetical protein